MHTPCLLSKQLHSVYPVVQDTAVCEGHEGLLEPGTVSRSYAVINRDMKLIRMLVQCIQHASSSNKFICFVVQDTAVCEGDESLLGQAQYAVQIQ